MTHPRSVPPTQQIPLLSQRPSPPRPQTAQIPRAMPTVPPAGPRPRELDPRDSLHGHRKWIVWGIIFFALLLIAGLVAFAIQLAPDASTFRQ